MEVYILNSLFQRVDVVDKFESFIWTERYSGWGDFELHLHSTLENRNKFPTGIRLGLNESNYVMEVENIEDSLNDNGSQMLIVKGRSLEKILEDRIARAA